VAHADLIRGLTLHRDNVAGTAEVSLAVSLCPEARVYNVSLSACLDEGQADRDTPLAELRLQDSVFELYQHQCDLDIDLPGLKFPRSAVFVVAAGVVATLNVAYGNCET